MELLGGHKLAGNAVIPLLQGRVGTYEQFLLNLLLNEVRLIVNVSTGVAHSEPTGLVAMQYL